MARSRLTKGISAASAGLLVTLAVQIVGVPILLTGFGADGYANWLVWTAVPSYLSLMDLGLGSACSTRATGHVVDGEHEAANRVFSSGWGIVTCFSVVGGSVASAIVLLVGDSWGGQGAWVVLLQLLSVGTWLQFGFIEGPLRSVDRYPSAAVGMSGLRVLDNAAVWLGAVCFGSLVTASALSLACRLVALVAARVWVRRVIPWLDVSWRNFSMSDVKVLAMPSLSYLGMPLGTALANQGMLLLVRGLGGSSVELLTLNATRTACGLLAQIGNTVTSGSLTEITLALAKGRLERVRDLLKALLILTVVVVGVGGAGLAIFGREVLHLWTRGYVAPTQMFLVLMIITVVADVPWQIGFTALRASNDHVIAALCFVAANGFALATVGLLYGRVGLSIVPIALLWIDVLMWPLVLIGVRRKLHAREAFLAL